VNDQIARNKRRTFLILLGFVGVVAAVVVVIDLVFGGGIIGLVVALVVASVLALVTYFSSAAIALRASDAHPASEDEYRRYHNLVEGLCIAAGLPKPQLYVVRDAAPNAFATGRNPKHADLAVTTGMLDTMNRVELEGVLATELAHVKNYDILVSTIVVFPASVVALVGRIAPAAGRFMAFATGANRDFVADASGVQLTRYPPGLASALEKLRDDHAVVHHATRATAPMWIEQPLDTTDDNRGARANRRFDTHPPLEERIRRLREM
jgi:heat shock protein HtpX